MMRARSFLDRPEILIRDYDHAAIRWQILHATVNRS